MPKKLTNAEYIEKIKKINGDSLDYSLVKYTGSNNRVRVKCSKCGTVKEARACYFMRGFGCANCSPLKKLDTEDFINRSKEIFGEDRFDYSETVYSNIRNKVALRCKKCNNTFEQSPREHFSGFDGCRFCGKGATMCTGSFIYKSKKIHGETIDYGNCKYIDSHQKVELKCNKCFETYFQRPNCNLNGVGCPKCNKSKGELNIYNYLSEREIPFEEQKRFDSCKHKNTLPFDFYLEDSGILIEYQGIQHFQTVSNCFFGGDRGLNLRKKRDQIKRDWCLKNEKKLIEIRYDEDIAEVLDR